MRTVREILLALREERKERGISVKEAAHLLGISNSTFSRWERGFYRTVDFDRLVKYAGFLNRLDLVKDVRALLPSPSLRRLRRWKRLYHLSQNPERMSLYSDHDLDLLDVLIARVEERQTLDNTKGG